MHGPDETAHTWKSSKTVSAAVDGPSSDRKTSTCSDSVPAPVETQSFETVPKRAAGMKIKPEQKLQQPPPNKIAERHASSFEEFAAIRSSSPILQEAVVHSRSQESAGLSSGDQKLEPVEREEWLESSPGFDVLVNDGSEDFECEDDAVFIAPNPDAEEDEDYSQYLGYDYEDNIEVDRAYPDLRNSFERGVHDKYHHVDDEDMNSVAKFSFREEDGRLDHTLQRKRTLCQEELGSEGRSCGDLRDYLKKRRVIDGQYPTYSQVRDRERPRPVSGGHLHGRLGSKVEVHSVGSRLEDKTRSNDIYKHARPRRSILSSSRNHNNNHFKQRRSAEREDLLPDVSRKIDSRKQKSAEESALFTGPKSLAQIKEEKRKALANGGLP